MAWCQTSGHVRGSVAEGARLAGAVRLAAYTRRIRRDPFAIARLPVWFCGGLGSHWGYLKEVRKVDDARSEYVCRRCGWQGAKKRPSNKLRLHWF